MKRRLLLSASLLGASGLFAKSFLNNTSVANEVNNKKIDITTLAATPPLGWNSFDSYGAYLHHEAAMANLKAMTEKLKPYGYEYFVIDIGWYGEFKLVEGSIYPREKHVAEVNINEYGIYQPSKTYFGKGFKPIVNYAHQLGLKMGIHVMRGIPRKAVDLNLPIKNSRYRAADIADKNSICSWNNQNYGVDTSKLGAQDWYDSVYAQIAEWDFDFVKVDDITAYPKEIVAISNAIEKTGRKILYSLSPGGANYIPDLPYYKKGNMLRITKDIWDRQEDIDKGFDAWKKYQGIAHKGFWPDLDMIPFGQLQLMSPKRFDSGDNQVLLTGFGNTRRSNFTPAQMRTFITMRSLAASPLFVGGDLPTMDNYSLALLTNKEMLTCNQNGECAHNIYEQNGVEVWITQQKNKPGRGWIGIFNRNNTTTPIELTKKELGLLIYTNGYKLIPNDNTFEMLDVWNNKNFLLDNINFKTMLEAYDVLFLRFVEKA
jgi:hypothetical protein